MWPGDIDPSEEGAYIDPPKGSRQSLRPGVLIMPFLQNWKRSLQAILFGPALTAGIKVRRSPRSAHDAILLFQASRSSSSWHVAICPFGAPATAFATEVLIAGGCSKILFFGYCGSLQPHITPGDLVVPTEALREEGTSFHYLLPDQPCKASQAFLAAIERELSSAKLPFSSGKIWTTDAPFRETRPKVDRLRREGILAVEMEVAAVFAVCAFRGVEVGAILGVTDSLAHDEWTGFQRLAGIQAWTRICHTGTFDLLDRP